MARPPAPQHGTARVPCRRSTLAGWGRPCKECEMTRAMGMPSVLLLAPRPCLVRAGRAGAGAGGPDPPGGAAVGRRPADRPGAAGVGAGQVGQLRGEGQQGRLCIRVAGHVWLPRSSGRRPRAGVVLRCAVLPCVPARLHGTHAPCCCPAALLNLPPHPAPALCTLPSPCPRTCRWPPTLAGGAAGRRRG